jgi:hypothetical protein
MAIAASRTRIEIPIAALGRGQERGILTIRAAGGTRTGLLSVRDAADTYCMWTLLMG